MPYRQIIFANNEIYHIYNKSVNNEEIFRRKDCLKRALALMDFYRFPAKISYSHFLRLNYDLRLNLKKQIEFQGPLVNILAFSFMPNHYHMELQQLEEDGISRFISIWQNSFAKFFNKKNERNGPLFLEMFKAKRVETREELIHISRYIHLNPVSSFLIDVKELAFYPFTSFPAYLGTIKYSFVKTNIILSEFRSVEHYKKFVYDQADYQRTLEKIKNKVYDYR
ncbi:MAG: transposase [Microgenomates group bacterium]